MKVQKLVLKEVEAIEVNGEFEKRFINEKAYPVFLTNAAIKKGNDSGMLDSSLFSDLLKMRNLENLVGNEDNTEDLLNAFDESKMIDLIYLAFVGANRKVDLSYDDFIDLYHLQFQETVELYAALLVDLISSDNAFAKALEKSTANSKKK